VVFVGRYATNGQFISREPPGIAMAAAPAPPVPPMPEPKPKYLRAAYLSPGEAMLRETRATLLYYLPAPIFWLIVFGFIDYAWGSARWGWSAVPLLTPAFANLKNTTIAGHTLLTYLGYLLAFVTIVLLLWLLIRYLRWISTAYAVTTNRVIIQRGIISRDFDEIPVAQVRAIDVHQTPIQRLLGYGTIRLTSEAQTRFANEDWRGIPKPWEFQKLADAAAQRYTVR
jgi:membrane protein YdbS with pleckstrin-like domain